MSDDYLSRYKSLFSALSRHDYEQAAHFLSKEECSFTQFMDDYIYEHGLVRQTIMRRADVAVSYGYKLLTGEKHTKNRNIILRICIAMQMPLETIQKALSLYGMNGLGDDKRDSVISTGIVYRCSVDEIDEWLISLGLDPLLDPYDR